MPAFEGAIALVITASPGLDMTKPPAFMRASAAIACTQHFRFALAAGLDDAFEWIQPRD
jgi:hypothetical protein